MLEFFIKIKSAWDAGGVFIYPIHLVAILAISVTIERVYWLYFKSSMNVKSFLNQLSPAVARKDYQSAIQFCDSIPAPASRVAKRMLVRALSKGTREDIEAVEASALAQESHPIERRTSYLSMLANIATLLGLLGTISGLIASFAAAAKVDPSQKAELLAHGISEAMNCTAYGLVVAIFALVLFALLQGKTQNLLDEIKETAYETKAMIPFDKSDKAAA
ncbi:MAG: MotA/TolQ/ExbB proton channel family protein [Deltaproteobacteria bacterium]|nr:MotA/TolQ/ExbB proton channel family protein [Deltaproteobacteria bacterium]